MSQSPNSDSNDRIVTLGKDIALEGYLMATTEALQSLKTIHGAASEVPDSGRQQRIRAAVVREAVRLSKGAKLDVPWWAGTEQDPGEGAEE